MGYMLVVRTIMKQPEVMILKTPREWDKRREKKTKHRKKPVKVELDGLEKTTMVGHELMKTEVERMTELLKENRAEFTWSPGDMPGLDPSVAVHKLNLDHDAKKIVQKKKLP